MWQLLGFGELGTPERRYAILDPNGELRWTGAQVHGAMGFVLDHGLVPYMERDHHGGHFIREMGPAAPPPPGYQNVPPGRSGAR